MIIATSLDNIPTLPLPIALTIGSFDGVHLGHQHLFQELKKHGTPVVFTFSNHPSEILRPTDVPAPILTLQEKLELFEQFGIALTIVVPFTQDLSQIPYDQFLKDLREKLPFSTLVGGEDIRIGAHGAGNSKTLSSLGFKTVFLPKFIIYSEHSETVNLEDAKAPRLSDCKSIHISNMDRLTIAQSRELSLSSKSQFQSVRSIDGQVISSRLIRSLIKNHQHDQAQKWLGHKKGSLWLDSRAES
ncbi:MAG: FAD synthetase family protein [Rhabdochlamydiaceae bacterium]|nr:FAD synthetase family protein [Rhabdochlamydiaceae bacterium]